MERRIASPDSLQPTDVRPTERGHAAEELEARFTGACERVLSYARLRLSPELARRVEPLDVLHETWLEASRSFASFEERGPGSFERWLCGIAENRLRDLAKRERAAKRRAPEVEFAVSRLLERARSSQTGPGSAAQRADQRERLERALARLEPEERDALVMRHFRGATLEAIASELGRSETATRRLLGRALESMGRMLGGAEAR